jgi:hypothetical protein
MYRLSGPLSHALASCVFARGDDLFPKDEHGKPKTLDIDYVDVLILAAFNYREWN